MIGYNYNLLKELAEDMLRELSELDKQIECNLRGIKKEDIYIREFVDAETEDFKVFSPRSKEVQYKDEIKRASGEKSDYEERYKDLLAKRSLLAGRVERLQKILNSEDQNLTVLNIQEEDRQRIARELHDTSLQNLAHLVHKIELSSMYIDTDPIQAKLELSVINKSLKEIIDEIRGTIFDLRPMTFDDLGMKVALERLVERINEDNKFHMDCMIEDVSCETNLVMVTIYRIVQESLCNVVKHADAKNIVFQFKNAGNQCIIDIEDDGKGFEENHIDGNRHFGVSLMRERVQLLNGTVEIRSEQGKGTKIHVEIPLS